MENYKGDPILVHSVLTRYDEELEKKVYRGVIAVQGTTAWLTIDVARPDQVDLLARDRLFTENEIQKLKFEVVDVGEGVSNGKK